MKAYQTNRYGDPEYVLKLIEKDAPIPMGEEVLVKVHATTVNDYDWCLTSGKPYSYRLFFGLFKPRKKHYCPGMEVAGTVVKKGSDAVDFEIGDRVYGDTSDFGFGAYAEYQCINEKALRHIPESISYETAVSLPHASTLALQAIMEIGDLKAGQRILINGGGGGVGALGIQIAKSVRAVITGVDSKAKGAMMLELGCDEVLDYREQDFTKLGEVYDLIIDCRTNRYPFSIMKALKPDGVYVTIGGSTPKLLFMFAMKPLIRIFSRKNFKMLALKANKGLDQIERLLSEGKLKPRIDGPYPFEDLPQAVKRFGRAEHLGKIVVQVNS